MTPDTLLHRQINPAFVQEGQVTSAAFRPTPKDRKRLSVYDGDLISADAAWRHFTCVLGFRSAGVQAVSVGECAGCGVTPASDPEPFPEHAVIDFSASSESEIKKQAKRLKAAAAARGWLFLAERE